MWGSRCIKKKELSYPYWAYADRGYMSKDYWALGGAKTKFTRNAKGCAKCQGILRIHQTVIRTFGPVSFFDKLILP